MCLQQTRFNLTMTHHHQIFLIICYGLLSAGPLMLRHDLQFCLTSYYALSNVLSPITNNFYTNATSCFKTIQRNLFSWIVINFLARPSQHPIFITDIALFTQPLRQDAFPDIFEIKWSYLITYGQVLDFIINLPPMTS